MLAMTLMLAAAGCVSVASKPAICAGTEKERKAHASALASDGGDLSVLTGVALISKLDAGCG